MMDKSEILDIALDLVLFAAGILMLSLITGILVQGYRQLMNITIV